MKKLVSIAFIFVFLLSLSGPFFFFSVQLKQIKREVKNYIKNNPTAIATQQFTFTTADIEKRVVVFKHNGKEFLYKNRIYDVIKTTATSKGLHITAFDDTNENNLISLYHTIMKNDKKNKHTAKFLKIFPTLYFTAMVSFKPPVLGQASSSFNLYKNNFYHQLFINKINPPPEV